jgi:hypothetical protein
VKSAIASASNRAVIWSIEIGSSEWPRSGVLSPHCAGPDRRPSHQPHRRTPAMEPRPDLTDSILSGRLVRHTHQVPTKKVVGTSRDHSSRRSRGEIPEALHLFYGKGTEYFLQIVVAIREHITNYGFRLKPGVDATGGARRSRKNDGLEIRSCGDNPDEREILFQSA